MPSWFNPNNPQPWDWQIQAAQAYHNKAKIGCCFGRTAMIQCRMFLGRGESGFKPSGYAQWWYADWTDFCPCKPPIEHFS